LCSVERRALGRKGEDEAVKALKKGGYRIIERNYRCSYGEIDIVAVHNGVVVFIEVKTRGSDRFGTPKGSITANRCTSRVLPPCTLPRRALRIARSVSMWLA